MKYLLANLFFKSVINKIEKERNDSQKKKYELEKKVNSILKDLRGLKMKNDKLNNFFNYNENHYSSINIRKDKNGERCFVVLSDGMVLVYKEDNEYYRNKLHINFSKGFNYNETNKKYINYLIIDDIQSIEKYCNLGLGSLALEVLIKMAKQQNFHSITGEISEKDNKNKERRIHFYKKYGFTIKDYNEEHRKTYMIAKIELLLDKIAISNKDGKIALK